MRVLLGHTFQDDGCFGSSWIDSWLQRLRNKGFDVYSFSLVVDQNKPILYFRELDIRWRLRDPNLLEMYDRLGEVLNHYDVFVCYNGANIHPEFIETISAFTVYACFDDPEASSKLSRPVASSFDMAMVGNIAEVDKYKQWGVKYVYWWPLGFRQDDFSDSLTEKDILYGERDIDLTLLCERQTRYRKKRVDQFVKEFPDGVYHGLGWPNGFLPEAKRIPTLQRTKIGINIHNSTGPINFRTFYLPANGVLQICDNKSYLGKLYKLGEEVVGYDTIKEAIELTHYYLENSDMRRKIAAAGWKRAVYDYNETSCFQKMIDAVNEVRASEKPKKKEDYHMLSSKKIEPEWYMVPVKTIMLAAYNKIQRYRSLLVQRVKKKL